MTNHHQHAAESTTPSYLVQTHLTLSAARSEQVHSDEDASIGVIVEDEQKELSSINQLTHGSVSLIGRRRVMEDAITVAPPGLPYQQEFFAVYGGRGGPWVYEACHERLHLILANEISREGVVSGADWKRVMKASFNKMDDAVKGFDHGLVEDGFDGVVRSESTGSTATLVMVGEEEIVVANCGDSRAVLFSGGVALPLSVDHKPNLSSERMRLQNQGFDSRSIGHVMKQYLISDPEVNVHRRTRSDKFLIMASHGLWDVVSNENACAVVKNCLDGEIKRSFEPGRGCHHPSRLRHGSRQQG